MNVVQITRITRKTHTFTVPTELGNPTTVSVALLPKRQWPNEATVWRAVDSYDAGTRVATITLAGPDADPTGALVVPATSGDLLVADLTNPDIDAVKVERINVQGGTVGPVAPSLADQLLADLATKADLESGVVPDAQLPTRLSDLAQRAASDARFIQPVMVAYPERTRARWRVLFHTGSTFYSCLQDATGTIAKSVDNGLTWTTLAGTVGFEPHALIRLAASGTLIAVAPNPTPTVKRSTDDGATWTTVPAGLNYAPLDAYGITETPSGHVMVGEYGNDGNTVYRIRRSTDDGRTWSTVLSSPGTDGANDPGHIHSITYDTVAAKFVAFMDRANPDLYASADEGATWTKIGTSTVPNAPNFAAPMYFADHIAWGYDNQNNGKIARLSRADFYAGTWGGGAGVEIVAAVTGKVFYGPFPIDADTWIVAGASEHIGDGLPGSYAQEIYVVSDDGSRVTGGLVHASPTVHTNGVLGQRARLPGYKFNEYDHAQKSWVNLPTAGVPYAFASMPYTVADAQQAPRAVVAASGPMLLHDESGIWSRGEDGSLRQILVASADGRVRIANPFSLTELRLYESSLAAFLFSGVLAMGIEPGRVYLPDGAYLSLGSSGATASQLLSGTGSPEGNYWAPPGSMYLNRSGGAGTTMYVKESGTGPTGWVAFVPQDGSIGSMVASASAPSSPPADGKAHLWFNTTGATL